MANASTRTKWFYESASERRNSQYVEVKSSFGVKQVNPDSKSFDDRFNDLYESYKATNGIDIKRDYDRMFADPVFMNEYKEALFSPVEEEYQQSSPNDPHVLSVIENAKTYWDTKLNLYNESASMTAYLPISTLEFPVLVKQFFSSILKDIIEVESIKTPSISKHIRTTWIVDNQTGEELQYPECMFNGEWQKMYNASRGFPIREDAVMFDNGRLSNYDIISGLTAGTPGVDKLSFNFIVKGIVVAGETIMLRGNAITVDFATKGLLLNGKLDFIHEGTHINDTLFGQVDFENGTISMASATGQVEGVVFSGYLSNEKNLRSTSVREKREILRFNVEDGPRMVMPFTIEDIEDAAALLDINYYNRMTDEIVKVQEMTECLTVMQFLNNEYKKYNGVVTDPLNLESIAKQYKVDILPPAGYAGDPFGYITQAIQFRLKAVLMQITEQTKLEGLSFIIACNPMVAQLLEKFTDWKVQQGTSIGGIKVNNSYGFSTDLGANVRIVASNMYAAYSEDPIEYKDRQGNTVSKYELVLHVYGYPTDSEHISFRHLKFSSHLMTTPAQAAYTTPSVAQGGAYTIVTSTSRYRTISIQGIMADLVMLNSEYVYGPAPTKPPITGAPWPSDVVPVSSIGG